MDVASNWKALSGIGSNWEGLLDPINVKLRRYLVHYGERVEAVGDTFNEKNKLSTFQPEVLFTNTGLQNNNLFKYLVTDYLYATSEFGFIPGTAFSGYVAVASDEGKLVLGRRDILICWRGTDSQSMNEIVEDTKVVPVIASELFPNTQAKVHQGFLNFYTKRSDSNHNKTSARKQVVDAVKRLVDKYAKENVSITVAGYSLGAAIATLNAMDIVFNGYNKPIGSASGFPVTAFVYASPQVGDENFLELFNKLNLNKDLHLLRIRNANDPVPDLLKDFAKLFKYFDVGVELHIDTQNSLDTKRQTKDISHNLELYLYGIAHYQGEGNDLSKAIDFDLAVLNKRLDLLKDKYNVPPNWWPSVVNGEKLMVQLDSGVWVRIK